MGSIYINDLLVFSARLLFITKYVYIRFQEMCMFSYIFTKQVCKILYCAYILPCLFKTTAGTFVWSWGCPSTCAPSSSQPSTSLSTTSLPVQNSLAATRSVELAIQNNSIHFLQMQAMLQVSRKDRHTKKTSMEEEIGRIYINSASTNWFSAKTAAPQPLFFEKFVLKPTTLAKKFLKILFNKMNLFLGIIQSI